MHLIALIKIQFETNYKNMVFYMYLNNPNDEAFRMLFDRLKTQINTIIFYIIFRRVDI